MKIHSLRTFLEDADINDANADSENSQEFFF